MRTLRTSYVHVVLATAGVSLAACSTLRLVDGETSGSDGWLDWRARSILEDYAYANAAAGPRLTRAEILAFVKLVSKPVKRHLDWIHGEWDDAIERSAEFGDPRRQQHPLATLSAELERVGVFREMAAAEQKLRAAALILDRDAFGRMYDACMSLFDLMELVRQPTGSLLAFDEQRERLWARFCSDYELAKEIGS